MNDWIPGKYKNDLTLIIANREIFITESTLIKTMDTGADAFSCTMPWMPGLDPKIDEITHHNSFSECGIYIGGNLVMTGILYDVTQTRSDAGSLKQLHIFSKTADIIDSTMIAPYTASRISLMDRCKQLCDPFGISVSSETISGREKQKFSYVQAKQTDKIFKHLAALAAARGLLLSCDKNGNLLITEANINGSPVGTISEDSAIAEIFTVDYKGRNRYKTYRAFGSSARHAGSGRIQTVIDNIISSPRTLTFKSPENLPGEAKNAAEWMKNKSVADSMSFDFAVNSWFAPNFNLWAANTILTINSDVISSDGFNFLITKVEFKNQERGQAATLSLKPPYAYTIGDITEP